MWEDNKPYWVIKSICDYADYFDDTPSFRVCLMQGGKALDARTIGLQYEVEANFNVGKRVEGIDKKIDGISGTVRSLDGKVSGFETEIDGFRTEVRDKVSRTELKQTADSFSLTVANGTRPNLLWGSDLDLDGVDTTNKRAIQKHLGVGLGATKVDSTEWFEYLKGGGVGGADAIKAKVAAVNGEGNYYAGLYWQTGFGAKQHIKVKPNTKYTFSFWIRTEILQGSGYAVAEGFNMEGLHGGRKDRTMPWTDVKATNKWERKSYTFTTGDTGYIMVGVGLSGENDFSGLIYLFRPKLEEGDTATPWCAYDGTVEELLAGGFDIKNGEFTATADNFKVQNNKGEWTFLVDENGKLNAKLIDATEIYGMKIAQPFEAYASKEEMKNGKSLSWVLENRSQDYGFFGGGVRMNGVTSNIFNNTGGTVSFWLPLITPFKFCQVDIPNNVMLRAVAIYRTQWDGCRWYLLCPWEDNGSGGVRLKAFNG